MTIASAIQMTSTPDLQQNLDVAAELIFQAAQSQSKLVVLPEMFPIMGADETAKVKIGEIDGDGFIQNFLSTQAKKNKIWIVGGTIPIKIADPNRVRAACIVYNADGVVVARYDKIHLFDVNVAPVSGEYRESSSVEPGNQIAVVDSPIGKIGLAVCYDLRFPELFRKYLNTGVQVFVVPTAFTVKTGKAHWDILTRSRSIENLCYGIYACQTGGHSPGKETYGHSKIVDTWGEVLVELAEGTGFISMEIDLNLLNKLRAEFPAPSHQRIFNTQ